jgi:uncharacterized protein (TIGR03083 family)
MPGYLTADELIAVVDTEAAHFATEAERVLVTDPVPTCPGWTVGDLIVHLGGTHRWATAIVSRALQRNLPADEEATLLRAPTDPSALLPWFLLGAEEQVKALTAAPANLQAFKFLTGAPPARHFWARRQAHETTIHRVDMLAARLGRMPSTAEAAVALQTALDGVDELVSGFVPRRSSRLRTTEPFTMVISPTDAVAGWTVAVSDQPPVVSGDVDAAAQSVISGTSAALYLGLWNRGDDVAENGTVDALGHWREQVRISWS